MIENNKLSVVVFVVVLAVSTTTGFGVIGDSGVGASAPIGDDSTKNSIGDTTKKDMNTGGGITGSAVVDNQISVDGPRGESGSAAIDPTSEGVDRPVGQESERGENDDDDDNDGHIDEKDEDSDGPFNDDDDGDGCIDEDDEPDDGDDGADDFNGDAEDDDDGDDCFDEDDEPDDGDDDNRDDDGDGAISEDDEPDAGDEKRGETNDRNIVEIDGNDKQITIVATFQGGTLNIDVRGDVGKGVEINDPMTLLRGSDAATDDSDVIDIDGNNNDINIVVKTDRAATTSSDTTARTSAADTQRALMSLLGNSAGERNDPDVIDINGNENTISATVTGTGTTGTGGESVGNVLSNMDASNTEVDLVDIDGNNNRIQVPLRELFGGNLPDLSELKSLIEIDGNNNVLPIDMG